MANLRDIAAELRDATRKARLFAAVESSLIHAEALEGHIEATAKRLGEARTELAGVEERVSSQLGEARREGERLVAEAAERARGLEEEGRAQAAIAIQNAEEVAQRVRERIALEQARFDEDRRRQIAARDALVIEINRLTRERDALLAEIAARRG